MRVKHYLYGEGWASEPFSNNGMTFIKVNFAYETKTFIYPQAFNKGILIEIKEKQPVVKPLYKISEQLTNSSDLESILIKYDLDFLNKLKLSFVIKESIPIVWFGDIDAYLESNKRILTIGLNPSEQEFLSKSGDSLFDFGSQRFDLIDLDDGNRLNHLKKTLSNYFKINPYNWFKKYNKLLSVVDCSYGCKEWDSTIYNNTAIHIDIYSAIATSPTWGKLSKNQKDQLKNLDLFKQLFNYLNPDVVLISVNKQVFEEIFYKWKLIDSKKFPGNNYINIYKYLDKTLFLGTNMQGIPFGGINEISAKEFIKNYL